MTALMGRQRLYAGTVKRASAKDLEQRRQKLADKRVAEAEREIPGWIKRLDANVLDLDTDDFIGRM